MFLFPICHVFEHFYLMFQTHLKSSNQANNEMIWFRPSSLDELLKLKFKYRESAKIVVGNTELGVEMRAKRSLYPVMIQPTKVVGSTIVH